MKVDRRNLKVARLIGDHNDPEFATLEVGKTDKVVFSIEENDTFLTVIFVRAVKDRPGEMEFWDPFL